MEALSLPRLGGGDDGDPSARGGGGGAEVEGASGSSAVYPGGRECAGPERNADCGACAGEGLGGGEWEWGRAGGPGGRAYLQICQTGVTAAPGGGELGPGWESGRVTFGEPGIYPCQLGAHEVVERGSEQV